MSWFVYKQKCRLIICYYISNGHGDNEILELNG